jgi:hypothetical protein
LNASTKRAKKRLSFKRLKKERRDEILTYLKGMKEKDFDKLE